MIETEGDGQKGSGGDACLEVAGVNPAKRLEGRDRGSGAVTGRTRVGRGCILRQRLREQIGSGGP